MATSSEEGHLTNRQIVRLATAISSVKMKSIALGYLGIDVEKISSLSQSHREDYEAFNRDIIYDWMCRHSGSNQTEVSNPRTLDHKLCSSVKMHTIMLKITKTHTKIDLILK